MRQENEEPIAQFVDRFLQRTAVGVLLIGFVYGLSAIMYLVTDTAADFLDKFLTLLALLAIVIVLPVFVKLMRLRMNKQCDWSGSDSYLSKVFNKACVSAFEFTFILLILLGPLSQKYLTDLPTDFFINVVLSLSLGVLGISFFYRLRKDADELQDEAEEEL